MARSSCIYLIRHFEQVVATCTVKHEAHSLAASGQLGVPVESLDLYRHRDNKPDQGTFIPWEFPAK